jgi:xylulokinase
MRDLVAGVDSSTQSCTISLRRLDDGSVVAQARAPHPPTVPPCSEQDPRAWWTAFDRVLGELAPYLPQVAAISVGGQGHGLVLLDEADVPLRPAKLWNDTEAAPDAERLCQRLPPAEWAARTGSVPGPALTVSKLAWTARCHPGLIERAARIMLPADYLVYRLSGNAVTERGLASGTGYFNPFINQWDPELAALAAPGLDWPAVLPRLISSGASAGTVLALPALRGTVVGAGTGDNHAAALGLGIAAGDTVISLGTSGTVYEVTETRVRDASGAINGYADATGRFLPMVTTLNAAKVTDAVRRLLGLDTASFDALVLDTPAGAGGLVLVPYLDGERTPNLPRATGRLSGLRSDVTPGQFARAAVEGVLCGLLEGLDLLRAAGVVGGPGRLVLTGGAARSRAYRQVLADLAGRPVLVCPLAEAAAAGAAVQAAAALTGRAVADQAAAWRPTLELAAEPSVIDTAAVRTAYRAAAQSAVQESA